MPKASVAVIAEYSSNAFRTATKNPITTYRTTSVVVINVPSSFTAWFSGATNSTLSSLFFEPIQRQSSNSKFSSNSAEPPVFRRCRRRKPSTFLQQWRYDLQVLFNAVAANRHFSIVLGLFVRLVAIGAYSSHCASRRPIPNTVGVIMLWVSTQFTSLFLTHKTSWCPAFTWLPSRSILTALWTNSHGCSIQRRLTCLQMHG